jgi:hypothetical protein
VLAPLAQSQLAAWEKLAADWPAAIDGEGVHRCGKCGKGILLWTDSYARLFRYTHEQVLALIVLHLRNFHAELGPGG